MGDLSENGDYHAAKDEQGHMEGRIRQLEHLLENAEIIEQGDTELIGPGSIVTIVYEGDDDDMAERYLIGHLEEKIARARRHEPAVAPRHGAAREGSRRLGGVRRTEREAQGQGPRGGERLSGHP